MPPKPTSGARSRSQAGSSRQAAEDLSDAASSDPFDTGDDSPPRHRPQGASRDASSGAAVGDSAADKSIPKDLLTRILHDLFEKDATRVSRDANAAVGKYVDVFVREAIARSAVEKRSGFLEVEDLEKIAPQLLLDL
ncbi:CENP-S complex, centromere protein X [Cordyceps fumosorosea ARSEF 2679]|uniref:CENP-S complex, centromere protein X n=1 Tax=Cordyceps fumosorosea (strain ARSEF 2679) TaxID=1081104 RepID=A0A167VVU3_CORFA|nr:CENP-S complex, centromere protein X [Cordyceps fumosorosea ARSEF 2679]OAA63035.1 CENP-S complex, centromere protein X [Cordyceps fumosorosea ARSEF 2679]